jgi:four helix bundle protein
MQDFKKLRVWEKSHHLVPAIYQLSGAFPKEELYGLTNQIRRAAASIPANIAEGCGRAGKADLARFFQIAMGSASELEYHLLLAHDLRFLSSVDHKRLGSQTAEVKRMLTSLIKKLKTDD